MVLQFWVLWIPSPLATGQLYCWVGSYQPEVGEEDKRDGRRKREREVGWRKGGVKWREAHEKRKKKETKGVGEGREEEDKKK